MDLAVALIDLGNLQRELGRPSEAEETLLRALAIFEADDPRSGGDATARTYLGIVLTDLERYHEAELSHLLAIDIKEHLFTRESLEVSASLTNLAVVQQGLGQIKMAEASLLEALAIQRRLCGPSSIRIAGTLGGLGVVQAKLGRLDEAIATLRGALSIEEAVHKGDHLQVAVTSGNLGRALQEQGCLDAAVSHVQRALEIFTNVLGPEHPHTKQAAEQYRSIVSAHPPVQCWEDGLGR